MLPETPTKTNRTKTAGNLWPALVVIGIVTLAPAVALAQQSAGSRWTTGNPPTPSLVDPQAGDHDEGLQRLPPIENEGNVKPTASRFSSNHSPIATPGIAAQPQNQEPVAQGGDLVDWDHPNVVIGPEQTTRTVSHEELVAAQKPPKRESRYSNAAQESPVDEAQKTANSRFKPPSFDVAPEKSEPEHSHASEGVFARVFDEETTAGRNLTQPEVATSSKDGLSPIFACRLLGLPATKIEEEPIR